jgi:hypothetical protein
MATTLNRHRALFLLLALVCPTRLATAAPPDEDASLKQRLYEEAPKKWEEYAVCAKYVQGSMTRDDTASVGNVRSIATFEIKRNEHAKLEVASWKRTRAGKLDSDNGEVEGANPAYWFNLRRRPNDRPWVASSVVKADEVNARAYPMLNSLDIAPFMFFTVNHDWLVDLIRDPDFRVRSCRWVDSAGAKLVEVNFEYNHPIRNTGSSTIGGKLTLDPDRYWCVRSYDVQTRSPINSGPVQHTLAEIDDTDPSLPLPKLTITTARYTESDGKVNTLENRVTYNFKNPRVLPHDREFTLSAFGLPEPPGTDWPRRSIPLFVWVALGGVVCLACGVVIRRVARRRRGKRPLNVPE